MTDWTALRDRLRRDYVVVREEPDRLLLDCPAALGKWFVRVGRRAAANDLDLVVLVCSADGLSAATLAATNDNAGAGKLDVANDQVVLRDTLPFAGLDYARLSRTIADLVARAGHVEWALRRPLEALAALCEPFAQ
jgi:hypothetical protein